MDIMDVIREEQELDRLLFQEEMNEMPQQDWITEAAREFAARHVFECELMLEGEPVLIVTDALLHTDEQPYCSDEKCPCHYDGQLYAEFVLTPFMDGLLTFAEANALRWGENV